MKLVASHSLQITNLNQFFGHYWFSFLDVELQIQSVTQAMLYNLITVIQDTENGEILLKYSTDTKNTVI